MRTLRRIGGILRLPALSMFVAFLVGGVFIFLTDIEMLRALGTDPGGAIGVMARPARPADGPDRAAARPR